jgi:hypothetical protein
MKTRQMERTFITTLSLPHVLFYFILLCLRPIVSGMTDRCRDRQGSTILGTSLKEGNGTMRNRAGASRTKPPKTSDAILLLSLSFGRVDNVLVIGRSKIPSIVLLINGIIT